MKTFASANCGQSSVRLLSTPGTEVQPAAIYEQRRYKSLGGEAPKQAAAELVRGDAAPVELELREDDLKLWVDVTSPLSTGLFADLRDPYPVARIGRPGIEA